MAAFIKTFIFIFLIIFMFPNSGDAHDLSLKKGLKLSNPCGQLIVEKNNKVTRKLLGAEAFADYASPDHNTRHEPRFGNPGGRA
ncbi:hypothetical protein Csa_015314 [Cucumis sativus]|uniref:Uncharacterized protein n=1 Tax=Cucumis sativus TaxID=3659 RepID=A0A0A0KYH7_CUCSA|nr:hypothetical protein Csa_015314 [Cucumis sativus]